MAISNVDRVRRDGFSNSSATCSPASARDVGARCRSRRSAFIWAAIASRRSRSSAPKSRIERKSFAKLTGGIEVSIAACRLRAVFAVDADVLGAEIARPHSGMTAAAGAQGDVDPDLGPAEVLLGLR